MSGGEVAEIGAALRARRAEDELTKVRATLEETELHLRESQAQVESQAVYIAEMAVRTAQALELLDAWEHPGGLEAPGEVDTASITAAAVILRGGEGNELHLKVSDVRYQAQAGEETTGILVRAQHGDRYVRADIAWLDARSLLSWLRAQGGDNPKAEAIVGTLLGFPDLQAAAEAGEPGEAGP